MANETSRNGEHGLKPLDGTKSDRVKRGGGEVFRAPRGNLDALKTECANDLAQEGYLLVMRLDQGDLKVRQKNLDRQAREAGAGADVGQAIKSGRFCGKDRASGKERLAKMS